MGAFVYGVEKVFTTIPDLDADGEGTATGGQDSDEVTSFATGYNGTNQQNADEIFTRSTFSGSTVLRTRGSAGSTTAYSAVDYLVWCDPSKVLIHKFSITLSAGSTSTTGSFGPLVGGDITRAYIRPAHSNNLVQDAALRELCRVEFVDDETLSVEREDAAGTGSGGDIVVEGEVVESIDDPGGFDVQHVTGSMSGVTSLGVSISTIVLADSFPIVQWTSTAFWRYARGYIAGGLTGVSTCTLYKGVTTEDVDYYLQIVTCRDGEWTAQHGEDTAAGDSSASDVAISAVDRDFAVAFGGGWSANATDNDSSARPAGLGLYDLDADDNLRIDTPRNHAYYRRWTVLEYAEATGGTTIAISQGAEDDSANPVTFAAGGIAIPVDQGSETDTGLEPSFVPGALTVELAAGQETDTANPVTFASGVAYEVDQGAETDTANPVAFVPGAISVAVDQGAEDDTALPPLFVAGGLAVAVGQGAETDTGLAVAFGFAGVGIDVDQAAEVDTANPVTPVGLDPIDVGVLLTAVRAGTIAGGVRSGTVDGVRAGIIPQGSE